MANTYQPGASKPYRVSRSKIDLFLNCPRCFYLDRRLGIPQPPGLPFSLNSAVDRLLKKEFDMHRANGTTHPLMKHYGINAVPLRHEKMNEWRDSLRRGVSFLHEETNFLVTGGVDDIWVNPEGEFIVVDYKSTSKRGEVSLDAEWQVGYKHQMEVYQWLFRQNGYAVSDTGYFVYCNADSDKEAFDGKLEFVIKLIPYKGKADWIDRTLLHIHQCLESETIPAPSADCAFCKYRAAASKVEGVGQMRIDF